MSALEQVLDAPDALHCLICKATESAVMDSRPSGVLGGSIRRRRRCLGCGHRFTTFEVRAVDGQIDAVLEDARLELAPFLEPLLIAIRRFYGKE